MHHFYVYLHQNLYSLSRICIFSPNSCKNAPILVCIFQQLKSKQLYSRIISGNTCAANAAGEAMLPVVPIRRGGGGGVRGLEWCAEVP